jgi:predicted acetyltransferase
VTALTRDLFTASPAAGAASLPDYRRRGYATEILRQSLTIVRAIESNGGELESVTRTAPSQPLKRRYWIN